MRKTIFAGVGALALAACGGGEEAMNETTTETVGAPSDEVAEAASGISMNSPMEAPAPVQVTSGDPIRGKGGLEETCLAQVADVTRAPVRGTNRIEESEAAIEIYVNVDGAQAPWKCLGYKDGTIAEVTYTGDEGAL